MTNLALWLVTVSAYFEVWYWLNVPVGLQKSVWRISLLMLLCAPFNINDNVFTILGNAVSQKNSYALFPLYQKAEQKADAPFALYQSAGQIAVAGFALYQSAGQGANTIFALYQSAGQKADATFTLYQSTEQKAYAIFALYQSAGQGADALFALYQSAGKKSGSRSFFRNKSKLKD